MNQDELDSLPYSEAAEKRGERYVVCAAIRKRETGRIITGVRHFSPDMRATIMACEGFPYWKTECDQGFVDNFGIYISRTDAWILAEKRGQIRKEVSVHGTLFSENLY